jgi:hypothetical protein
MRHDSTCLRQFPVILRCKEENVPWQYMFTSVSGNIALHRRKCAMTVHVYVSFWQYCAAQKKMRHGSTCLRQFPVILRCTEENAA